MSYLIHFNPNHDKLGRFTFSKGTPGQKNLVISKYPAKSLTGKKSGDDSDLAFRMRKDFTEAYAKSGPGKNVKELNSKIQKLSSEANKMTDDYFKKNGLSLKDIDAYTDQAFLFFDQLYEKAGFSIYDNDVAHLMDLGYNKKDAKKVAEWMKSSIPWDSVWSDKVKGFVEPGGVWNEEQKVYQYFDDNGKVKYAIG